MAREMEMGAVYRAALTFKRGDETKHVIYGPYKSIGTAKVQATKYKDKKNGNLPYWFIHSDWELTGALIQIATGWENILLLNMNCATV